MLIKHKEIEGDQINEIIIPEDKKNVLYVHSRDNCIRLIEYETSRGTRVKKRFFGSKCQHHMIQSTLSTDGQILISGSETGTPFVWDAYLEQPLMQEAQSFECNFMDVVSDCDWNPRYNMFAVSGFGQEFPILVYVYERSKKELDLLLYEYGNLISQIDANKLDPDDP